jgi:hypothetical protein
MIWVVVGVVIVAIGLGMIIAKRRRPVDGVETFQRQIDALSPQARRRVVDRVQQIDTGAQDGPLDADTPDGGEPGARDGA